MADLLSGPETGLTTDPNAAPTDTSTLFGVSAGVFSQPLQTDAGFSRPPGMSGTNMMLNGESTPRGEGPSYGTVGDALESFYSMAPQDLSQLQQELYQGGFYSSSYYTTKGKSPDYGVADEESYAAFKTAVIRAARSGTTLDSVLQGAGQGSDAGLGGPGPGAAPGGGGVRVYPGGKVSVTQTDPQTIRDAANATAQKYLGRDLSDKEAQAVVDKVRGEEDTKGRQQAALDESSRQAQIQSNEALYGNPAAATVGGQPAGASDVVAAITQAAQAAGVPPALAIAIAQHESGMNPQAVGDQGTSFGLYQLHQGGELGSMSKQQAFDPYTNATRALAEVAAVMKQHPDWSPGQIAAAAQRPANQAAYAAAINSLLQGQGVSVQGTTPGGSTGQSTDVFLAPTVQDISTPITPQGAATQQIQSQNVPEMQEYGAQRQIINFTQALHSMPGDTGAANAKPVAP